MIKKLLILTLLISLMSCDIKKRAIKSKEDRVVNELQERTIKRKGDTVTYQIPNFVLKDTTIYTVNRQGTTLRTVYDNTGSISQIECFSSLIEITERLERMTEEVIKNKDKDKEENFDSSVILYGFIGLGGLMSVVCFFGFRFLGKNTALLNQISNKL